MVKKKVKKQKALVVKKSPEQVKKDLILFEKGIGRLRELKKELSRLDTRGFSREERTIRLKLKNVSDIPLIEKGIKILRLKIDKKYRPKHRRTKKTPYKQIIKNIKDLEKNMPEVEKNVLRLNKKLSKVQERKKQEKEKEKARVKARVKAREKAKLKESLEKQEKRKVLSEIRNKEKG